MTTWKSRAEWLREFLTPDSLPVNFISPTPMHLRMCKDAFAGSAGLTQVWDELGLPYGKLVEAYKDGNYLVWIWSVRWSSNTSSEIS